MPTRFLRCFAVGVIFSFLVVPGAQAQAAAEYAGVTAATSSASTARNPPPMPTLKLPLANRLPASPPSSGVTSPSAATSAGELTEAAAKANLKFFQDRAGVDAAGVSVSTVPDHAEAWIDDRYVGATPLNVKLGPGQHRVFVSGANSSESFSVFNVTAKQAQTVDLKLKSGYQGSITIQGASTSPNEK